MFKVKIKGVDNSIYANSRLTTELSKHSQDLSKKLCDKILYASYFYVPQDTNTLLKSGKVTETKAGYGRVVYDATNRQRMDALLQRGTARDLKFAEDIKEEGNLDESYAAQVEFDDTAHHRNGQAHFLQKALEDVLSNPENTRVTIRYYNNEISLPFKVNTKRPIEQLKKEAHSFIRYNKNLKAEKMQLRVEAFQEKHPDLADYARTPGQINRIKSDVNKLKNNQYVRLKPWMEGTRYEDARDQVLLNRAAARERAIDERHRPKLGPKRPVGRPNRGLTEQHKYRRVAIDKRKNTYITKNGKSVKQLSPGQEKRNIRLAHGKQIEQKLHQIRKLLKSDNIVNKKTGKKATKKDIKHLRLLAERLSAERDYRYYLQVRWYMSHMQFKGSNK